MKKVLKKLLILLLTLTACSNLLWAQDEIAIHTRCVEDITPGDSLLANQWQRCRPVTNSIEAHLGSASVRNTYLAPMLYTGQDMGLSYERTRRWKQLDWESLQLLSGQFTMGEDKGAHSENRSGRLRYRYAAHYNWDCYFFTLMAGPYVGTEVGFDYNLKMASGNNPATARLALNTGLSLMAATRYRLFGRHSKAYALLQAPLMGYALMPEYGASYYESFYLGNVKHLYHFTSLHNQQDLDFRLITDVPLFPSRGGDLRLGIACHIETMKIQQTITRLSAIEAVIGWTFQSLPYSRHRAYPFRALNLFIYDEAY